MALTLSPYILSYTLSVTLICNSWEYPGAQGIGCNNISPKDTAHLLSFLKELRGTAAGKKLYLSAAAPLFPWADANGDSSKDVSGFAKVLDHIAIMKCASVCDGPSNQTDGCFDSAMTSGARGRRPSARTDRSTTPAQRPLTRMARLSPPSPLGTPLASRSTSLCSACLHTAIRSAWLPPTRTRSLGSSHSTLRSTRVCLP
jgi:hypothetical protein